MEHQENVPSEIYPHWSPRMAWHIPSDWDGVSWDCCLLFWPDSPDWTAIIEGHLMTLSRGRSWDETTGSIQEVQAVARLISLAFRPSEEARQLPEVAEIMSCFTQIETDVAQIRLLLEEIRDLMFNQGSTKIDQLEAIKIAVSLLDPGLGTLITLAELGNEALGTQDLMLPPGGD